MNKLFIGIPSKGRLQENTAAFFARAGLPIHRDRGDRDYRGRLKGLDNTEVLFLSASEIATELVKGGLHLGITGEDLIREEIANAEHSIVLLAPLGFGQADVAVAVPEAWIDVIKMEDLEDVAAEIHARQGYRMRVATKYTRLTRQFFAAHGVSDYRIVESLGATEGAPLSGGAEAIVDITTTGATLAANGLKVLEDGVILRSQANLVGSVNADWRLETLATAKMVLGRIFAEERARLTREIRVANLPSPEVALSAMWERFGVTAPFGFGEPLVLHVSATQAATVADRCIALGATHVVVGLIEYIFTSENTLFKRLVEGANLKPGSVPEN
ncbi:MAG: ATP phosphoribosyltransferase [Hyphomicrobiales bacterium]|nr:ATP phosphoribosyltransferase [Hyphomicrobiales bacterium]